MTATLTIFLLLLSPPWLDIQSTPMPSIDACARTKAAIESEVAARIGYKFGVDAGREVVVVVTCSENETELDK